MVNFHETWSETGVPLYCDGPHLAIWLFACLLRPPLLKWFETRIVLYCDVARLAVWSFTHLLRPLLLNLNMVWNRGCSGLWCSTFSNLIIYSSFENTITWSLEWSETEVVLYCDVAHLVIWSFTHLFRHRCWIFSMVWNSGCSVLWCSTLSKMIIYSSFENTITLSLVWSKTGAVLPCDVTHLVIWFSLDFLLSITGIRLLPVWLRIMCLSLSLNIFICHSLRYCLNIVQSVCFINIPSWLWQSCHFQGKTEFIKSQVKSDSLHMTHHVPFLKRTGGELKLNIIRPVHVMVIAWLFKIQRYFIISSEKLKYGWTLITPQYTKTHFVSFIVKIQLVL